MTRILIRRKALLLYVLLCLALSACANREGIPLTRDQKLQQFVSAADKVADTALIIQDAATSAETAGNLTRNQTRFIMEATRRLLLANNSSMDIVRDLSQLPEATKADLLKIMSPVIREMTQILNDTNITGIQNPTTKATLTASLQTIQASLNSINLILAASN